MLPQARELSLTHALYIRRLSEDKFLPLVIVRLYNQTGFLECLVCSKILNLINKARAENPDAFKERLGLR
jgi:hypothetical protein